MLRNGNFENLNLINASSIFEFTSLNLAAQDLCLNELLIEDTNFSNIILSSNMSSISTTVEANWSNAVSLIKLTT